MTIVAQLDVTAAQLTVCILIVLAGVLMAWAIEVAYGWVRGVIDCRYGPISDADAGEDDTPDDDEDGGVLV